MRKKLTSYLVKLRSSMGMDISSNKYKIVETAITAPLIAAGTMSGACASGCPYGLVNDPFPGQCGRYVDADGDGICDLSQTATNTAPTDSQSGSQTNDTQNTVSNGNEGRNDVQVDNSEDINVTTISDPGSGDLDSISSSTDVTNHYIFPITLLLVGSYLFTHYLFSKGILKPQQHKRIWNLLLMTGYLGTGITGILLTLMINMGISTVYNQGITFWHAELSILMVIGTLIHLHIYRKPIKRMFKVFGFKSGEKKKTDSSINTK